MEHHSHSLYDAINATLLEDGIDNQSSPVSTTHNRSTQNVPRPLTSLSVRMAYNDLIRVLNYFKCSKKDGSKKQHQIHVSDYPLVTALIKRELVGKTFRSAVEGEESIWLDCKLYSRNVRQATLASALSIRLEVVESLPNFRRIALVKESFSKSSSTWIVMPSTLITILNEEAESIPHAYSQRMINSKSFPKQLLQDENFNNAASILLHTFEAMARFIALTSQKRVNSKSGLLQKQIESGHADGGAMEESYKGKSSFSNQLSMMLNLPRSFVFTGPPGVGKSYAIKQVVQYFRNNAATSLDISLKSIRGSELQTLGYGDSGKELQNIFEDLVGDLRDSLTSLQFKVGLIFIDEGEALLQSNELTAKLGFLLDKLSNAKYSYGQMKNSNYGWERIVVVIATNHLEMIPTLLRRPGRLDLEIQVLSPNVNDREKILRSMLSSMNFLNEENEKIIEVSISDNEFRMLAEECVGYVASDLNALVRKVVLENGCIASNESNKNYTGSTLKIRFSHFQSALKTVGASALRDAALSAPPLIRWNDIGGNAGGAKEALRKAIEWPRLKFDSFSQMNLSPPRGILLHGPPGCAKTTLAKAAAGSSGISFFSLSPADVYASSYVGEAEAVVRRAFALARSASPCMLFFDEIDAILGSGGSIQGRNSSSAAESRVLSTFLNEMDGVDTSSKDGVLVLGATNRPSTLDAALLRPGRFDKIIYVPPPDLEGRKSIFSLFCKKWDYNNEACTNNGHIDIDALANENVSGRMTGAEIKGACQDAATMAFQESLENKNRECQVLHHHLLEALEKVKPLLHDNEVLREYEDFEKLRKTTSS